MEITTALEIFKESAILQAEATKKGDYKTGNKNYDKLTKAADYLKKNNAIDALYVLLHHPSIGVRMWSASYLLPIYEHEAIQTLENIATITGIHSLTAKTTLSEWRKGNLSF